MNKNNEVYMRTERSVKCTKKRLKKLINANVGNHIFPDLLASLTFNEVHERKEAVWIFRNFCRRLNDRYGNFEYIAFFIHGQKNLYIKCLFFDLSYITCKELQAIWNQGIVKIDKSIEKSIIENYAVACVDSILKDGTYILKGEKAYICSKNLRR